MTSQREIKASIKAILDIAEGMECKHLPHAKKDFHDSSKPCPVESRVKRRVEVIKEFAQENGIDV